MKALVVDASAIVEYLLKTALAPQVAEFIEVPGAWFAVPSLCDIETVAALRRALIHGRLPLRRALDAISDYKNLALIRYSHLFIMERILELRANMSAYDATYVALAEQVAAELVTADRPLALAARSHTSLSVHLVE